MGCMPILYTPAVYLLIDIKVYNINKPAIIGRQTQQTQQAFKCKI